MSRITTRYGRYILIEDDGTEKYITKHEYRKMLKEKMLRGYKRAGSKTKSRIRGMRTMENTMIASRGQMMMVKGDKIEEFLEKSKNGASKKMVEKFSRLEAKRKQGK